MHTLAFLQGLVAGLGPGFDKLIGEVDRLQAEIERVSASARDQTTLVEEAARAHAGVTEAVRGIGEQTAPGSRAAREGSGAAEVAEERLARAFQTARGVEDKAARIEEAVALIGDVADQTELVSLNAAIEAARAGEAGRGFTSVAQQLRKLADRSASAAAEMGELVESVLEGVRTVAIEARESMDAGGDLRRHLEAVSQGLESLLKLSGSASEAAAKEGASLESLAKLSADAGRELHNAHAVYDALRVQLNDLFRNVRRATAGRRGGDEGDEQRPLPAASESVLAGKVAGAG
jgi:methyl-accepting chemotaxis protein